MAANRWADLVLSVHFLYVLGVVLPVPVILVGYWRRWAFIRNNWFRNIHLAMIGYVAMESIVDAPCPLTLLENHFRRLAGQPVYQQSCIHYWVARLLFHSWPLWVFTTMDIVFGALVLAIYFWIAPEWLRRRRPAEARWSSGPLSAPRSPGP